MKGSQTLHFKSSLVEEAANELINMLLDTEVQVKKDEKPVVPTGEINGKNAGKIVLSLCAYCSVWSILLGVCVGGRGGDAVAQLAEVSINIWCLKTSAWWII